MPDPNKGPVYPAGVQSGIRTDAPPSPAEQKRDEAKQQVGQAKEKASQAAAEARGEARHLRDEAAEAARNVGEQIQESGAEAAEEIRRRGADVAAKQKEWAADELSHLSHAMRTAADHLHEEDDHNIADYAETTADRLQQASRYLRTSDWRRLMDDAQDLGRRRPELLLGGMFVAGLGIARFLKASNRRTGDERREQNWQERTWTEEPLRSEW